MRPLRKLTLRQYAAIPILYRKGIPTKEIGRRMGITHTHVGRVLRKHGVRALNPIGQVTHGHGRRGRKTKENLAWWSMIARCRYPSFGPSFGRYGGRGIKVCRRWQRSFTAFLRDVGPAPTRHHSIGRIDNDGDYRPSNVRWVTRMEQARNTRASRYLRHRGQTLTIGEWGTRLGINRQTIGMRLDRYRWSVAKALTTPVRGR